MAHRFNNLQKGLGNSSKAATLDDPGDRRDGRERKKIDSDLTGRLAETAQWKAQIDDTAAGQCKRAEQRTKIHLERFWGVRKRPGTGLKNDSKPCAGKATHRERRLRLEQVARC